MDCPSETVIDIQGKVGEQVVRQPPTNENCLIKKGMLRVISGHKKAVELSAAFLYSIDFQLIADL